MFPITDVRARFPALALTDDGRPRVYLDGPGGTQVPDCVIDRMTRCLIDANANHAGAFRTSVAADAVVAEAHAAMADLVNAGSPDDIVVGANMTTLTYAFSRSIGVGLSPGDEIVVTNMDHEGNISPWLQLANERGLTVRWMRFDPARGRFADDALTRVLSPRTRLVALGLASNLIGTVNQTARFAVEARTAGALVYVDAVQYAPHRPLDVAALGADFVVWSAYKVFGPHLGVLWGRSGLLADLPAFRVRTAPTLAPGRWETGTANLEGEAGLIGVVDYLGWLADAGDPAPADHGSAGPLRPRTRRLHQAMHRIAAYEDRLTARLLEGLAWIPAITVLGLADPAARADRVPTVAFTVDGVPSAEVARRLALENIFVWSGHNYALEVVRAYGIDEQDGVVRIGLVHYTTAAEVDAVLDRLATWYGTGAA